MLHQTSTEDGEELDPSRVKELVGSLLTSESDHSLEEEEKAATEIEDTDI